MNKLEIIKPKIHFFLLIGNVRSDLMTWDWYFPCGGKRGSIMKGV